MSTGPIFIKDIKKEKKRKRRRPDVIDVNAKGAYAFVNEKTKRREKAIKRLAGFSRQIAGISEKYEAMILRSWPIRKASDLVGKTWPVRAARKVCESLQRLRSARQG